ncbi:AMP-binding protein [Mycolicibacterium goodii]|uniref:AMP-binding protein n=1 Tax=Mycolicibacterium goodii TaxID=134601 RepID=UPI001BDC4466|nr:AMP-binding protein [Mycolicibacterium goodii]MBU8816800.1 AMP-binding protein [Mycolicibacterium goodii]MBU8828283.1 AMP-binding protein [Mycolicibacterium goodii]
MYQLTIDHLLWRMQTIHPRSFAVDVSAPGDARARRSFPEIAARAGHVSAYLHAVLGIGVGDVVGILAFNTSEHLEALFAVPRIGAVVNSLNVRLSAEMLTQQALSPRPAAVLVDAAVVDHPVVGDSACELLKVLIAERIPLITIGDRDWSALGATQVRYTDVLAHGRELDVPPGVVDENVTAFLFHTSGTTGRPKMYAVSHRAVMLHALAQSSAEASGLTRRDIVMPLAPFFHVNGWGLPFTCAMTGASLVLCGADLSAHRVGRLMSEESVTVAAAVPTIWHDVCAAVTAGQAPVPTSLHTAFTGGSAVSRSVADAVRSVLDARLVNTWGMTETMACSTYERDQPCTSAGNPMPLVEFRVDTTEFSHQGAAPRRGRLQVRGPFVIGTGAGDTDWFDTGDIASIDDAGTLALHDRDKDLIKSGGEWIATAELEQHLCEHPAVTGAVVVAAPDPRWTERPHAYLTVLPGTDDEKLYASLRDHVSQRFPRWWTPDRFITVEEFPMTSVGKVDKTHFRQLARTESALPKEAMA